MATRLEGDRVLVNNRWVHGDGSNLGFLNTGGDWSSYTNNSGQMWSSNYGWLHDYFFSAISNCAIHPTNGGNAGNCYNGPASSTPVVQTNCGNIYQDRTVLEDGGATLNLRTYRYQFNCNCNCACDCC